MLVSVFLGLKANKLNALLIMQYLNSATSNLSYFTMEENHTGATVFSACICFTKTFCTLYPSTGMGSYQHSVARLSTRVCYTKAITLSLQHSQSCGSQFSTKSLRNKNLCRILTFIGSVFQTPAILLESFGV